MAPPKPIQKIFRSGDLEFNVKSAGKKKVRVRTPYQKSKSYRSMIKLARKGVLNTNSMYASIAHRIISAQQTRVGQEKDEKSHVLPSSVSALRNICFHFVTKVYREARQNTNKETVTHEDIKAVFYRDKEFAPQVRSDFYGYDKDDEKDRVMLNFFGATLKPVEAALM